MAELSTEEITLLKLIPEKFKYIARNVNRKLKLFIEQPIYDRGCWREKKQKRPVGLRAWQTWFPIIKSGEVYEIKQLLSGGVNESNND